MAKFILTTVVVCGILIVSCGCSPDSGQSQLVPAREKAVAPEPLAETVKNSEGDLVEKLTADRQAYRTSLGALILYYNNTGNNMKLGWANDELKRLNKIPQYEYIFEAKLPGPELRATASIPQADYLYDDAVRTQEDSGIAVVSPLTLWAVKSPSKLRLALDKYNILLRDFPTSDKIDDAAYNAARIQEYFQDYTIALLYYQRTYQWSPANPYPARYRAAKILDTYMYRRAEALELYQQSLQLDNLGDSEKVYVKDRIAELTAERKAPKEEGQVK